MALIIARQPGRVAVLLNPEAPIPDQRAVVLNEDFSGLPPHPISAASLLTRGDPWEPVPDATLPPDMAAYLEIVLAAQAGYDRGQEARP